MILQRLSLSVIFTHMTLSLCHGGGNPKDETRAVKCYIRGSLGLWWEFHLCNGTGLLKIPQSEDI
jgi:hypothetical protein